MCPIAKIPNTTLATRNPVCCEVMSGIFYVDLCFVSKNLSRRSLGKGG